MTSQAKLIRQNATEILKAASIPGINPANIKPNRVKDGRIQESDLPLVCVYTNRQSPEIFNESPREYRVEVELAVHIIIGSIDDLEDFIDDAAQAIRSAFFNNYKLTHGGVDAATDSEWKDLQVATNNEGAFPMGECAIIFSVEYFTHSPDETAPPLGDFEGLDVQYDLANPDGSPEAGDDIDLPTT